tara:strand:+ start:1575 stop:1898 length:324 start_codon:yes stop_codon:yes gene_type:complete
MSNLSIVREITSKIGKGSQKIRVGTDKHKALRWAYRVSKGAEQKFTFNNFGVTVLVTVSKSGDWLTINLRKVNPRALTPLLRKDYRTPSTHLKTKQDVFSPQYGNIE